MAHAKYLLFILLGMGKLPQVQRKLETAITRAERVKKVRNAKN